MVYAAYASSCYHMPSIYMEPWEYDQMQQWGKKVTKVLRHTNRKDKLGDGVTMDPEKLAVIMSSRLGFKLNIRDV